jgi:F-box-like
MSSPNQSLPQPVTATLVLLTHLPPELLLHILTYLDIPDLLPLSRTSHHFRHLTLDPLLHSFRLRAAALNLAHDIPLRPRLAELMNRSIYVTRTTMVARNLGRKLVGIKLNRKLGTRPGVEELVGWGVLPGECYINGGKGGLGRGLAPGLVEVKRKVERERVRDFLRGWVEEWRRKGSEIRKGEAERVEVRWMARRFAEDNKGQEQSRWGRRVEVREAPTRAKVLGLRRFWEKVGREGVAG